MFWCSKRLERVWRVLEWEKLHFCCSHLRGRNKMCKFSLYIKTKLPIRLNIFDTEDFLGSLLREEGLLDTKIKYMKRFLEDFALGGKP